MRTKTKPKIPIGEAVALPTSKNNDLFKDWLTGANLLNPKVGAFYIAAIPQFIPADTSLLLMGVVLSGVHCLLGMAWFTLLILDASYPARWLKNAKAVPVIDSVTGTVLVGFGPKLALEPSHQVSNAGIAEFVPVAHHRYAGLETTAKKAPRCTPLTCSTGSRTQESWPLPPAQFPVL